MGHSTSLGHVAKWFLRSPGRTVLEEPGIYSSLGPVGLPTGTGLVMTVPCRALQSDGSVTRELSVHAENCMELRQSRQLNFRLVYWKMQLRQDVYLQRST